MGSKRKRRELPKGRSWPLRQAQLLDALAGLGAPAPSAVVRSSWSKDARVIGVSWNPLAHRTAIYSVFGDPWAEGDENVVVWVHDVASPDRLAIEQAVLTVVVPALAQWLIQAASAPEGWRLLRHDLEWSWIDEAIVLTKDHEGRGKHRGE
jgi:hypothetical protein